MPLGDAAVPFRARKRHLIAIVLRRILIAIILFFDLIAELFRNLRSLSWYLVIKPYEFHIAIFFYLLVLLPPPIDQDRVI